MPARTDERGSKDAEITAIGADVENHIARAEHVEQQHGDVGFVKTSRVIVIENGFLGEVGRIEFELKLHALVAALNAPRGGDRRRRRLVLALVHCSAPSFWEQTPIAP